MKISYMEFSIPRINCRSGLICHVRQAVDFHVRKSQIPLRFNIFETTKDLHRCELTVLESVGLRDRQMQSIFEFIPRTCENTAGFNTVLVIPTGIGAEIGGHAGDACVVAKMLGEVSDILITHPNVVNASDINEMPENCLYVEGSVIARLMMGTVVLQPVRSNRILVVMDCHEEKTFMNETINAVNAACASYGLSCPAVVALSSPLNMKANYSTSGQAVGEIEKLDILFSAIESHEDRIDAVAVHSIIQAPFNYHTDYFESEGGMVNPWGGVEAMLTHFVSSMFNLPSAHAPMLESKEVADLDPGVVDPRMASEAISSTFLQCVLKGLQKSPGIFKTHDLHSKDAVSVADVSCLVVPDGCLGVPVLAALEQGIPVISVKENKNIMRNRLEELPWGPEQFHPVENYWEVAGVIACMRAGIAPSSIRRPIARVSVESSKSLSFHRKASHHA